MDKQQGSIWQNCLFVCLLVYFGVYRPTPAFFTHMDGISFQIFNRTRILVELCSDPEQSHIRSDITPLKLCSVRFTDLGKQSASWKHHKFIHVNNFQNTNIIVI